MEQNLIIRESSQSELDDILKVERKAFNSNEEAELVQQLLEDPTAEPRLSLLAFIDDYPVGHILFSRVEFDSPIDVVGSILSPLAVMPDNQKKGIGGQLIEHGLAILKDEGVDWVFVLGHVSYYLRFGFKPALKQGFQPPYPIPSEFTNAWMTMSLSSTSSTTYLVKVIPPKSFHDPKYWRE